MHAVCRAGGARAEPGRADLILTARREESDKVLGLESGADVTCRSRSASASWSRAARVFAAPRRSQRQAESAPRAADRDSRPAIDPRAAASASAQGCRPDGAGIPAASLLATLPASCSARSVVDTRVARSHVRDERSGDSLVKRLRRASRRTPRIRKSFSPCGAAAIKRECDGPIIRRSLYWRIGLGFILFLASRVLQVALFIYVAGETEGGMPARMGRESRSSSPLNRGGARARSRAGSPSYAEEARQRADRPRRSSFRRSAVAPTGTQIPRNMRFPDRSGAVPLP